LYNKPIKNRRFNYAIIGVGKFKKGKCGGVFRVSEQL
jgi:hypothetical protein